MTFMVTLFLKFLSWIIGYETKLMNETQTCDPFQWFRFFDRFFLGGCGGGGCIFDFSRVVPFPWLGCFFDFRCYGAWWVCPATFWGNKLSVKNEKIKTWFLSLWLGLFELVWLVPTKSSQNGPEVTLLARMTETKLYDFSFQKKKLWNLFPKIFPENNFIWKFQLSKNNKNLTWKF